MKVIYIRTSTKKQEPKIQLRDIYTLIYPKEIDKIYADKQSAWKDDVERDSFNRLKQDISEGLITDVYVWDWDRIYRNRIRFKEFFSLCKDHKVMIHSYRQTWYESINKVPYPFNEFMIDLMLNLMGWLAEDESQKKSARIRSSVVKKNNAKSISYKGNVWGRKFVNSSGNKINVSLKKTKAINRRILWMKNNGSTIKDIQEDLTKRFDVVPSYAYISGVKSDSD